MNDLLFYTLIMALLIYFLVYLPRQKKLGAVKTATAASTQTELEDKQITNLIRQWNQVAEWAKEEGIDINKRWNLGMLKKKLTDRLNDLQNQINREPIKVKYSRGTQTNSDSDLEANLDELLANIRKLNSEL